MHQFFARLISRENPSTKRQLLLTAFTVNFFFSLHVSLVVYVHSTLLTEFFPPSGVGLVFALGALAAVAGAFLLPKLLSRVSTPRILPALCLVSAMAVFALGFSTYAPAAVILYIVHFALHIAAIIAIDVVLENSIQTEQTTGSTRGLFLTVTNAGLIISPFIAGAVVATFSLSAIYMLSALSGIIAAIIAMRIFGATLPLARTSLIEGYRSILKNRDLSAVLAVNLLLWVFYTWMAVYLPLLLTQSMGLPWEQTGIILSLMLLPFLLLPAPLGFIADRFLGETEMLIVGFVVMTTSAVIVAAALTPVVIVTALIASRVGASMIEAMTDSYFFKHTDGDDHETIAVYRTNRALGYLVSSGVAAVALIFMPLSAGFAVLGGVMFLGVPLTYLIRDTR